MNTNVGSVPPNSNPNPNPLPTSLYENLVPKLVAVLDISQRQGPVSAQSRQTLLRATNEFKQAMNEAKELAIALPGGELLIQDQDEVIEMLERIKKHKRLQLEAFSTRVVASTVTKNESQMEIDSMASTPMHQ